MSLYILILVHKKTYHNVYTIIILGNLVELVRIDYRRLLSTNVEFFVVVAIAILFWFCWQLIKAKRFTKFKQCLELEIKPKVFSHIIDELNETRSTLLPNNEVHQQATLYFWGQYKVRILQAALTRDIIDEQWLKDTGNIKNSQHLFFIERDKLV